MALPSYGCLKLRDQNGQKGSIILWGLGWYISLDQLHTFFASKHVLTQTGTILTFQMSSHYIVKTCCSEFAMLRNARVFEKVLQDAEPFYISTV